MIGSPEYFHTKSKQFQSNPCFIWAAWFTLLLVYVKCKSSRHTVVCRAAQEAGTPPVSILTGRKKMQFSHLCTSVIPYPIGTKFAREVPMSQ